MRFGGFACYGEVDTAENASGLLPIGLAEDVRITRDIAAGAPVPLDAVDLDDRRLAVRLWLQQQALSLPVAQVAA